MNQLFGLQHRGDRCLGIAQIPVPTTIPTTTSHAPHPGTLAAARTEVVGKLGAAVTAMLHAVLVAIDIVRHLLLPAAEAAVVLF